MNDRELHRLYMVEAAKLKDTPESRRLSELIRQRKIERGSRIAAVEVTELGEDEPGT